MHSASKACKPCVIGSPDKDYLTVSLKLLWLLFCTVVWCLEILSSYGNSPWLTTIFVIGNCVTRLSWAFLNAATSIWLQNVRWSMSFNQCVYRLHREDVGETLHRLKMCGGVRNLHNTNSMMSGILCLCSQCHHAVAHEITLVKLQSFLCVHVFLINMQQLQVNDHTT